MAASSVSEAQAIVEGIGGGTSSARGAEIHRFVRENRFDNCLELGFAHGVSSVWIASALEANGSGSLTSVDILSAHDRSPTAAATVDRADLTSRVELVYEETSYTWFLHRKLREQLRDHAIEPLYDFVFIDGAHTWDADGFAFLLVDRLLKPGGWILLDDMDWTLDAERFPEVPDAQRQFPHVQEIWDLLVGTDARYDVLRSDGQWGWAQKSTSPTPSVRTVVNRDLVGSLREVGRLARSKLGIKTLPG